MTDDMRHVTNRNPSLWAPVCPLSVLQWFPKPLSPLLTYYNFLPLKAKDISGLRFPNLP